MQETGAPEEIRTPDPQIRSFVLRAIEERRYAESLTRARQLIVAALARRPMR